MSQTEGLAANNSILGGWRGHGIGHMFVQQMLFVLFYLFIYFLFFTCLFTLFLFYLVKLSWK